MEFFDLSESAQSKKYDFCIIFLQMVYVFIQDTSSILKLLLLGQQF
jgi:hypothetical protein